MSIKERLDRDLKAAMKARDTERMATLRMAISAMTYRRIERTQDLSEAEQLDVLRKQVKQREDSITEYARAKRDDLAAKEERERVILQEYLPPQMDAAELRKDVEAIIAALPPQARLGDVMKAAMPALKERASGKAIGEAVRDVLAARSNG
ncbi:MAG: GatB/YqeY domain-containing protein [Candidatus Eremiobacteraeota bacterium]|nr:GatB/YqeY domain-containing protein [Candidatus Eremiobacteraeota bacterium]